MGLSQFPIPRAGALKDFKSATRTAGNVTFNTTSFANFDTNTDLVLQASVGDVLEIGAAGLWGAEAIQSLLGVFSVVGGTPVNSLWPGADVGVGGIDAWMGLPVSTYVNISGSFFYTVVSSDLSNGTITLRLRGKCGGAVLRTLFANTTDSFQWSAKNLGQVGGWAAQSGTSVTAQTAAIGSNVSLAAANTYYDGPSLSLVAGTYLISGAVSISGQGGWSIAKIWDGTTVYSAGDAYNSTNGGGIHISLPAVPVVLASTTTVKLSAATDTAAVQTMKAATSTNGTGTTSKTTYITAVKIA